jgi:hypothetical protein
MKYKYILLIIYLFNILSCNNKKGLLIIIPNDYIGEFYIVEDKKQYQVPDLKALQNFGDYIYELKDNENIIKVNNINIFKTRTIGFSYVWCAPVNDNIVNIIWENKKTIKIIINETVTSDNISIYQKSAINYDSKYFHINDYFDILGNMEINGKIIVFANNMHIWGSSRRATWRLLLFLDDGTFLGMYVGIQANSNDITIEVHNIFFTFDPKNGNIINFLEGIPNEVWIDGNVHAYEIINDIK